MKFKIITIPFNQDKETFLEEEINNFCLNKKIKNYRVEFFNSSDKSYWTVFFEYETIIDESKPSVQFSEAEKLLFDKLKEWRKEAAEKKGFPVYIVCNNTELADLVKNAPKTLEELKNIQGFGKKKIEKYGKEITELIKNFYEVK